jgi:SHS2 domain-containing protein
MSDVFFEAWGPTLEEAYRQAALAFYETLTDPGRVLGLEEKIVKASGMDLEELLYDWIERLIILFDSEGFLAREVAVERIWGEDEVWRLRAILRGERYDPGRHPQGTHVKGVTYHMMVVDAESPVKRVRVLLDI